MKFKNNSSKMFDLDDVITFGKCKGSTLSDVIEEQPEYIEWVLENVKWFKMTDKAKVKLQYETINRGPDDFYEIYGGEEPF